jgi:hypothetical protein
LEKVENEMSCECEKMKLENGKINGKILERKEEK